ncbi:MAG TPA: hypothetical protein VN799_04325 [Acidimicrobiales bacterium]|nr:hypothetical protein [Acidimicrobiales bacterium]
MRPWSSWAVLGLLAALTGASAGWSLSTAPTLPPSPVPGPVISATPPTGFDGPTSDYSSTLTVDGVTLVHVTAGQRGRCQTAADQLGFAVPCPTLVPDPIALSESAASCAGADLECGRPSIGITRPYFIWNQYNFQVPATYVGVPDETSVLGGPLGHFIIYAGSNLNTRRMPGPAQAVPSYCAAVKQAHKTEVHGSVATLYTCADSSNGTSVELDVGHELLVWKQSGVTCEVSLHGHSRTNELLDFLIAEETVMIAPR